MPGLGLALGASWDRDGIWSPALRLVAAHHWLHGVSATDGEADFELDTGGLDACPLRIGGVSLALRPCANLQVGRLLASGSNTFQPRSRSRPFAALGASLVLEWLLPANFETSFGLSAGKTLILDEFAFTPTVFHRVSAITLGATLGVSLRFP